MGHTIPTQHPAVVLRSHYDQLRALLAAALIAIVGLTVAVVILATDDHGVSISSAPVPTTAEFRLPSHARIHGGAPVPDLSVSGRDVRVAPGTRYDGGPNEGTRRTRAEPAQPGTRYDGGPDEGTRGPAR